MGWRAQWDQSLPTRKDKKGHPLTVAGLAHTAFPKRAQRRGHVVIATAELGAPALTGLILLGLGRKAKVGKLEIGLALGGNSRLPGGEWQQEGQNREHMEHNPSPGGRS